MDRIVDAEPLTHINLKEFATEIAELTKKPGSNINHVPMRNGNIARGCLIRFRIGTAF